jgi:hypothetical protein
VGLISNLKYKYGLHRLKNDFRKPENNAVVCNLKNAASIGVIYNATKIEDFNAVKYFVAELKKITPEVFALGYVNKKELDNFHIQPLEFLFFCLKDLNKYYKPNEGSVTEFANKEFSILIDLNLEEVLSVRFVLAESKALFKVGRRTSIEPNYYDLMLDINPADENALEFFIEQVQIYLNMIKNN